MKTKQIPIYDNRAIVGYASSIKGAEKVLRSALTIHPKMSLSVWRRPQHLQEILELPDGFVYSVSYTYK
jgi:hypothetical protein